MTYPILALHLNGTGIIAQRDLVEGNWLVFRAENIREAASGIHARLEIYLGKVSLAWTTCNIEKEEERLRLANRAHKLIPGDKRGPYLADFLKHDLDYFCHHLWDMVLSKITPENLGGEAGWEPDFLLKPFVIRGGGTIMFAPPKTMKSYSALLIAQSVNTNCSQLWPVQYENTLFVNLERSRESVRGRLARVNAALGLPADQPLHILHARGQSLKNLLSILERYIAQHKIGFGVLDSISRTGMGGLISPEEVNPVIDSLSRLFPSWLALAHTPRGSVEHPWGGQMWDAGADILLMLKSQANTTDPQRVGVCYTMSSANDLMIVPPQLWEMNFTKSLSVSPALARDYPELAKPGKMSLTEEVMDYLLAAQKATATQISQELNRNRGQIANLLSSEARFVRVGAVGPRGQVYYGVKTSQPPTPEAFR